MTGKWVGLLKDVAPEITRVGFLFNPQTTAGGGSYFLHPIDAAASAFKVKAAMALVHDDDEIEAAFAALARESGAGAVVLPDIFTAAHRARIIAATNSHRIPAVFPYRYYAVDGGLAAYREPARMNSVRQPISSTAFCMAKSLAIYQSKRQISTS